MRFPRGLLKLVIVLALAVVVLRVTHPLPDLPAGDALAAISVSDETRLGAALLPLMEQHEGLSGVAPLADGRDALAARILLARAAEQSIDVQYYIWQMDTTGWLLLEELRAAAERGVRVRILLDDDGIPGLDNVLAGLDEMNNVEIRIFNPFTMRSPKLLSYAFDFDVLAVCPAAADVSADFDIYWTSGSSYAAADVLPASEGGLDEMAAAVAQSEENSRGSDYALAVAGAPVLSRVLAGEVDVAADRPARRNWPMV